MKRRNFLAGLIAAPVAVAAAPELAKAEASVEVAPTYAWEEHAVSVKVMRNGFNEAELKAISDAATRLYAEKAKRLSPAQLRALAEETI